MSIRSVLAASQTSAPGPAYRSWTIEWFAKFDTNQTCSTPYYFQNSNYINCFMSSDFLVFYTGGNQVSAPITNYRDVWRHYAVESDGTHLTIYYDGIARGRSDRNGRVDHANDTSAFYIGCSADPTVTGFTGKISNFRIVRDTAIYHTTGSYTIPTSILPAVTGTELLLQGIVNNNPWLDNSSNLREPIGVNATADDDNPFGASGVQSIKYVQGSNTVIDYALWNTWPGLSLDV
jgi:Concanavalin A-like lectin/glucanases superfamily